MHEWSLVLFTLLIQSAAGLVVIGEILRLTVRAELTGLLTRQVTAACVMAGLGLVLSLTHLGTPMHSIFTIANLGTSWLSREIVATGLFFGLLVLMAFLGRKGTYSPILSAAASLVGMAAVFAMSRVYMLRTVPVWDSGATTLGFFGTMFFMGAVLGALFISLAIRENDQRLREYRVRLFGSVVVAAAFGLTLQFIGIPLSIVAGSSLNAHGLSALNTLFSSGTGLLSLRVALLAVGGLVFAWNAVGVILKDSGSVVAMGVVATLCVTAGEVIGRLMFYTAYTRIGL